MEWWQTLLVSVLTPAVTAIALIWQTAVNNKRDDRRQAIEVTEHERERRHLIRDHWRAERREAHAALLADFESIASELSDQLGPFANPQSAGSANKDLDRARQHFAVVQMLSLAATRVAAEEAFEAFRKAELETWAFRVLYTDEQLTDEDKKRRTAATNAISDLAAARRRYLDAVRKEIGTDEDGS